MNLRIPTHENDLLLEYPVYWDSYETAIDLQIDLINKINEGQYELLELLAPYYSKMSTLLFDKLYCADFHHIYRAVVSGEANTMNREVINEFFKINFANQPFNYDNLLQKIREDIANAVKEHTLNLPIEQLKEHAYISIDSYISTFQERYWLQLPHLPLSLSEVQYQAENFVRFRRAKQLEEILYHNDDHTSIFLKSSDLQHHPYLEALYGHPGVEMHTTYFINISKDQFFDKEIF